MAVSTQVPVRNRLLATLAPADFSLLEPQLERVPLLAGMRLIEPNTPIEHVYFLEQGIASVVATTPQDRRIEVGIIGREGADRHTRPPGHGSHAARVLRSDARRRIADPG